MKRAAPSKQQVKCVQLGVHVSKADFVELKSGTYHAPLSRQTQLLWAGKPATSLHKIFSPRLHFSPA